MRVRLLFRERDFDWSAPLPWNEHALRADLALDTLWNAMAQSDKHVLECSRKVILAGVAGDIDAILYRQSALQDCLNNSAVLRDLYALAVEATEQEKKHYLGNLARYPHWVLRTSVDQMEDLVVFLERLRDTAERHAHRFTSEAWTELFTMLKQELDDAYIARVRETLERLKFHGATLLSAELGEGNRPAGYVLHQPPLKTWKSRWSWLWEWLFPPKAPPNSFSIIRAMKLATGRWNSFTIRGSASRPTP